MALKVGNEMFDSGLHETTKAKYVVLEERLDDFLLRFLTAMPCPGKRLNVK